MRSREFQFSSESVTEGHPDKIADQVSDSVLDAVMAQDPEGRVAIETLVTTGLVVVAGELGPGAATLLEMSGIRIFRVAPGVKVSKAVEKALREL